MSFSDLFAKMKLSQKDAEIIFDRDEPVGTPTDIVMPRRRWFRRKHRDGKGLMTRSSQSHSYNS